MSLATLLNRDLIAVAPTWRSFEATIDGLLDLLVAANHLPAERRADVRHAVVHREAEGSTAVPEIAISVPHARVAGLHGAVAALAVARNGLYEPIPTVRIRVAVLLLSPTAATEAHLKLLAGVATGLRSAPLRAALLEAHTPDDVMAALQRDG